MPSRLKITVSPQPVKGSVYFLRHGAGMGDCDEHFIVVLIPECEPDKCLVIGVITSKVEKRELAASKDGFDPGTVVRIAQAEFPEVLRVDSAVDCNSVKKVARPYFDMLLQRAEKCPDMPTEIVNRILEGVTKSDNVSETIRQLAASMIA